MYKYFFILSRDISMLLLNAASQTTTKMQNYLMFFFLTIFLMPIMQDYEYGH